MIDRLRGLQMVRVREIVQPWRCLSFIITGVPRNEGMCGNIEIGVVTMEGSGSGVCDLVIRVLKGYPVS